MNKRHSLMCMGIGLYLMVTCGMAAGAGGVAVAPKISTLGVGGDVIVGVVKDLNLRGGGNWLSVDYDGTFSDIDYQTQIDLLSYSLLADWYCFGGSFRISGGVLYNQNEAGLLGTPAGTIDIGGDTYAAADVGTLTGRLTCEQEIAPYVGIGWGNALAEKGRVGLMFDIGVVYTDSPTIALTASGPIAGDPTFQQSLARELRDLQDQANDFKWYPVLSLSLYIRF